MKKNRYDFIIVGGGFYGCCLALYLRSHSYSVLLLEKEDQLMLRASAINQARVHTGFHYPRSLSTAIRSLLNFPRFVYEFRKAIVDDFTMLYAIARQGSKVNAKRFFIMFKELNAPIVPANTMQRELFSSRMVEDVFATTEYAFDHSIIRNILAERLAKAGVEVALGREALSCQPDCNGLLVNTPDAEIHAGHVFNCTYSRINNFLEASGEASIALKHEITEIVLVEPPKQLHKLAVTVMDGPFFSIMPFPAEDKYSLSHVRYTPHTSWQDQSPCPDPHSILKSYEKKSRFVYMDRDVRRFMPNIELKPAGSLFEIKTVLVKNETDDGRPIFYKQHEKLHNMSTVMGSKIDNVYDLFESLRMVSKPFAEHKSVWRKFLGQSDA